MLTEAEVRDSLRSAIQINEPPGSEVVYEFWVPQSNERADIAVIGTMLCGFEIKTHRDTLKRLPRQISAYGRLFDRCNVVLAPRHVEDALSILPEWWGVLMVEADVSFKVIRTARANPSVDAETLVRLLWRDELYAALCEMGQPPHPSAGRFNMWKLLLALLDLEDIKQLVRDFLLRRDPGDARIPSQRFSAK